VARFIEGLRQANGIVAGISEMAWPRFLAFNALGAALWVTVWTSVGYLAGNHITTIYDAITRYSLYALIALAAAVAAFIIRTVVRRRRRAQPAAGHEPSVAAGAVGVTAPEPGVQRGVLHTDSVDESGSQPNNHHHGTSEVVQRETQAGEQDQRPREQDQQPEVGGVANQPVPPAGGQGSAGPDHDPGCEGPAQGEHSTQAEQPAPGHDEIGQKPGDRSEQAQDTCGGDRQADGEATEATDDNAEI
jgi:hypothetical protein